MVVSLPCFAPPPSRSVLGPGASVSLPRLHASSTSAIAPTPKKLLRMKPPFDVEEIAAGCALSRRNTCARPGFVTESAGQDRRVTREYDARVKRQGLQSRFHRPYET